MGHIQITATKSSVCTGGETTACTRPECDGVMLYEPPDPSVGIRCGAWICDTCEHVEDADAFDPGDDE